MIFNRTLDRDLIVRIQGFSLDVLIVSAIATLSLGIIGENLIPFFILALVGITWNLVAFIYLTPLMIPTYWFERGSGNFGQSMGMTATGILLMKLADRDNESPSLEGFGYKQLLFEPIVGGNFYCSLCSFNIPIGAGYRTYLLPDNAPLLAGYRDILL
ncbi:MAG: hypothetical protein KUA33_09125 [Methanobacterium sp.]|nr:hypothetical protein [Euryarchaeota archaeon]MBV1730367.1 hypothetical protein [Methanobacterium sp.]MBV1754329.1 hypothetical protein [Methanobacterium sp.]MBV1768538.1 hypothetical protein [Methanobacterium sp.]